MLYFCEQGFRVVGVEGVLRPILELRSEQRMRLKDFKDRTVMSRGASGWVEEAGFEPSQEFQGGRRGEVFKLGARGLGYYTDSPAVWRGKVRTGNRTTMPLHVIQADMFDVTPDLVASATFEDRGRFDVMYDRGGLDSIPPSAWEEYVAATSRLLRPGGRLLLTAVDYDQAQVPIDPTGRRFSPPPFSVPESEVRRLFPEGVWKVEVLGKKVDEELSDGNPAFHGVIVSEVAYLITKSPRATDDATGGGGKARMYAGGAVLALAALGAAAVGCR